MVAFHTCHPGAARCLSLLSSPSMCLLRSNKCPNNLPLLLLLLPLILLLNPLHVFKRTKPNACWLLPKCWMSRAIFHTFVAKVQHKHTHMHTLRVHSFTPLDLYAYLYIPPTHPLQKQTKEELLRAINLIYVRPPCLPTDFSGGNWCRTAASWISAHIRQMPIHYI